MRREIAQELERERAEKDRQRAEKDRQRAEKDRLMKQEIEDLRKKLSREASLSNFQVNI